MPTYEYRCKECLDGFEVVQAFSDDALTECTKCGGPLKKVYGNVGISFKGSGFYKNDARGKTSSTTASSSSSTDTASGTKAETTTSDTATSTEKKPAKKEAKPASTGAKTSSAD